MPHQHRGPHQHKGTDDHVYSPKLHNGTFKSQGIATFMGAPYCPPDRKAIRAMGAKLCFIGVPWDQGQVVRAGTSQGAAGIREASTQYFPYMFEYDVDLLTFFRVVDCGDIPIVPGNNTKSHEYIYDYLTECLHGGAKVVLCGGDHSVPIPGARALSDFHKNGTIGYLHVDCHSTRRPIGQATPSPTALARRARSTSPTATPRTWCIWARATGSIRRTGTISSSITTSVSFQCRRSCAGASSNAPRRSSRAPGREPTASISPGTRTPSTSSCMPGTTAPECFGLKGREIIQLARTAGTFGADIMEVSELCPEFDVSHISIKTAALMIYHFLGSRAKTLRDRGQQP